jgi:[acyl-carrier-protein] S-malonyltransferase
MGKIAFLFPGQGSQYVGMGRDLVQADPEAEALVREADAALGIPLSTICFEGPEDRLRQTEFTQPAIFLHSMLVARMVTHLRPEMVAGHSLGEYSALVVAGAMEFTDALRLVRLRGELMQRAGTEQRGTMAAVMGLTPEVVEQCCREASDAGIVQPANFNSPGQIVISGSVDGVRKGMECAKARGGKVRELVVSGAFHSPLMETAREGLTSGLDRTPIRDARIPVYANVTAAPVSRAEEIRDLLRSQLTAPVRWEQTLAQMSRDGATEFIELGPGKVLQNFVKRSLPGAVVSGFDTLADLRSSEGK